MSNEIFYTKDGLSQDERNIPALSEKYFLLSPEKLNDIIVRLGVYAKDSSVDICNNKTFTFLCFILAYVIKDGNRLRSINEVRVVLQKFLETRYVDKALYKGWFTKSEKILSEIRNKLIEIREENFSPDLDESFIGKLDATFIAVSDLLDSLKIDAEQLYNEIISKDTFEPSYALYITTARLLKHFQDRINNLPDRRIDFYYQKVLGFCPRQAKGDTVNLVIPNVAKGNSAVLPKGTRFEAGTTQNGEEIIFETTEETSVNDAKIQQIFTMGEPSKKVEVPIYDLSQFPFKDKQESFPLFGKFRSKKQQTESESAQNSEQSSENAETSKKSGYGYAFASEVFRMENGDRRIFLKLDLDSDVKICKDNLAGLLNPNDIRTQIIEQPDFSTKPNLQKNIAELIDKNINDLCIEKRPFKPFPFKEDNPFVCEAPAQPPQEEKDIIPPEEFLKKIPLINKKTENFNDSKKQLMSFATKDLSDLLDQKINPSKIASIENQLDEATERFFETEKKPSLLHPNISIVDTATTISKQEEIDAKAKDFLDKINSKTDKNDTKAPITALISTESGWYNVPEADFSFNVQVFKQIKSCKLGNAIAADKKNTYIIYLEKTIYSLVFDIKIPNSAGKIVSYNPDIHGYSWKTKLPVLYVSINTTAPEALKCLLGQSFENTEVHTVVKNCKNITVQNDFGKMDATKPFLPFGSIPRDGSSFILGCPEFLNKTLDGFMFKAKWANLNKDDFNLEKGIYKNYIQKPSQNDLTANVEYLKNGTWEKVTNKKQLFIDQNSPNIRLDFAVANPQQKNSSAAEPNVSADDFVYNNDSKSGFLKLTLNADKIAFGHSVYSLSISNYLMKQSFGITDEIGNNLSEFLAQELVYEIQKTNMAACNSIREFNELVKPIYKKFNLDDKIIDYQDVPKEPYTPILENLSVDYNAYAVLNPLPGATATEDRMFFLQPFGESYKTPEIDIDSAIYIGFSCTSLPKILSLFFHLNQDSAPFCRRTLKGFTWRYLTNDGWKDLLSTKIVKDSTFYFTQSGIVSIRLPKDIVSDNPQMPVGLYWLKITADDNNMWRQCCSLFSIYAQGVEAVRVCGFEGSPEAPLIPRCKTGTISKIVDSVAGLNEVCQLADSFGGKLQESNQKMRLRAAERLYHHNRAVSIRDIERMVLEKFPVVAKVKCFGRLDFDNFKKFTPGSILIVPIAPVENKDYFKWNPRFNAKTLFEIRDYVKKHISGSADVKVANPYFEKIKVCGTVKVSDECDIEEKKNELINALGEYISPWYATGNQNHFGWRLLKGNIESYIYDFDYVKDIENFRLEQVGIEDDAQKLIEQESEKNTFTNSYPWSVAVPVFDDFFKVEIQ